MPIFRRCVEPDDATVLVSRCFRPEAPMAGEFMLLLTYRRLVVTQETKVFHRLRLHLNVVRILSEDLRAAGQLTVHVPNSDVTHDSSVLRRVIDGLRAIPDSRGVLRDSD